MARRSLAAVAALAATAALAAWAWSGRWGPPARATSWDELGAAEVELEEVAGVVWPVATIPPEVKALAGQRVELVGFMFPIDAEVDPTRFLLVELPADCPFCFANWSEPARMAEIWATEPVGYVDRQVTLQGRLEINPDDASGILYRLLDARTAS
ncbi:MAG TPA: hypothetical protein VFY87_01815 [Geminicoccaceae bacterium]|nr:hypothetical protein [Geminicoccaceae bacterium]